MKSFRSIACGLLTIATLAAWSPRVRATTNSSDNACNYSGTWTNGNNFGSGFGPWAMSPLPTSGNVSYFVGSAGNNGNGCASGGGINASCGSSWGIFANNNNTGAARRSFNSGNGTNALQIGQTFAIAMDNGFIDQPGTVGVSLENSSSNFVFQFYFRGGSNNYAIADSLGNNGRSTGIGYTEGGLNLSFKLTSPSNYSFNVVVATNNVSVNTNYTGVISNAVGGAAITQVRVFNFQGNGGNGCNQNTYYNNMSISCPALSFSTQPTNLSVCAGSSASFTVAATNTAAVPTYQWQKGGVALTNSTNVSGATSTTLTINPVSSVDAANYNCVVTDACGNTATSSNATLTITTISLSPTTLPNVSIGVFYSQTVSASGGTGPYTFSLTAGSLPTGLSLLSSGSITGTYSGASGSATFTITATDQGGLGCQSNRQYTINMINCPTITVSPGSLPAATVGAAYSQTISASGGTAPYTFVVNSGSLPPGLTLTSTNGVLSGTPTLQGSYSFGVLANDTNGCPGATNYTLTVNCTGPITVSPGSLPNGTVGTAYSQTNTASGGTGPYAFAVTSGSLPAGLALNGSSGVISGTPTNAGASSFTVTATDTYGCTGSQAYSVTMSCPTITVSPATLPFGVASISYSTNLTASGGIPTYKFTVTSGTLPAGLTLSSAGLLSGTPTLATNVSITITATDTNNCTGSQNYSLTVGLPPAVTAQPNSPTNCAGTTASFTVTGGGSAPLSYLWRKRGTGWGAGNAWAFTPTGCSSSNGFYNGASTGCSGVSPGIDSAGTSLGLYANGGAFAEADRNFGNLQVGQSVVLDYQNPRDLLTNGAGSIALFSLRDSNNVARVEFYFKGGEAQYTLNDASPLPNSSGIPYTSGGLHLVFTLNSTNTYSLIVSNLNNGSTYLFASRTLTGTVNNAISQLRFFLRNSGGGGTACQDFFINSIYAGGYSDGSGNYTAGGGCAGTWLNGSNAGQGPLTDGGKISGSATANLQISNVTASDTGTYDVIIYNAYGSAHSGFGTLTVNPTPSITTGSLSNGVVGVAYSQTITATGGTAPRTFSTGGPLPNGLTLGTNGVLSGTPSAAGSFPFTVTVTDSNTCSASSNYTVNISCPAITVSPTNLANVSIGIAYNQTVTASGGAAPYTFAVTSGSLPAGITNTTSGQIAGTYTGSVGSATFTITATDTNGCTGSQSYTVQEISCPSITLAPGSLPSGTVGSAYSQTITASGGTGPYTYSEVGALPGGVTLSSGGVLSGTPTQSGTFNITVTATDTSTGCAGSQNYSLVINCQTITASISGAPAGPICAGTPVNLTASGSNTVGSVSYSWTKDASAFATTQTINDTPSGGSHTYAVTVTDTNGCSSSPASVTITVNTAPVITSQPTSQSVCSNSTATFTVATSDGSASYFWRKRNSGWGSPWSFSPSVDTGNAGFFIGTSTNNGASPVTDPGVDGDIDSTNHTAFGLYANASNTSAASRGLNPPLAVGQTLKIDMDNGDEPGSSSVGFNLRNGATDRFEVAFRGGSNDYVIVDSTGTSRDTGVHFTTQGLHVEFTLTGTDTYSVTFSQVGTDGPTNLPITMTGTLAGTAGTAIDTLRLFNFQSSGSPGDGTNPQRDAFFNNISYGCIDDSALNYTSATWTNGSDRGNAPLANGGHISGANTSTLTVSNVSSADIGGYDVCLTNSCGITGSTNVTLSISAPPGISVQPQSQTVCAPTGTTFSVTASNVTIYLWLENGSALSNGGTIGGSASATLTISATSTNDSGSTFAVVLSSGSGCVLTSQVATLTVLAGIQIIQPPTNQMVCAGSTVVFTAAANGPDLTYQWNKNGSPINNGGTVSGATTTSLTLSNVVAGDSGATFSVTVAGGTGCAPVDSSSATLIVNTAPVILGQPSSQAACVGGGAGFTVNANGTGLTYLWRKGASNLTDNSTISGSASATLSLSSLGLADNGATFSVVVSGTCTPSVTSTTVTLTVNSPPVITAQPLPQTSCDGWNVSFTVTASNATTFAWRKNGTPLSNGGSVAGATTTTLTLTGVHAADSGSSFDVAVGGNAPCASSNSTAVTLTVDALPAITNQPAASVTACSNSAASFTVGATGDNLTYQWRKRGAGWASGWSLTPTNDSGTAGFFIGSSTNNDASSGGDTNGDGDIDTAGRSWGLYANSSFNATEARRLSSTPLSVGQTVSIDVDNGDVGAGGLAGFSLRSGGDDTTNNVLEFFFSGTTAAYEINQSGGYTNTGIGISRQGVRVVVTLTSASTYSLSFTRLRDGAVFGPYTGSLIFAGSIDRIRPFLINPNAGGPTTDLFINSITFGANSDDASDSVYTHGGSPDLLNGDAGGGSNIVGATSSTYTIANVQPADVGSYDVLVGGTCRPSMTSSASVLSITSAASVTITAPSPVCGNSTNNSASVPDAGVGATYTWSIGNGSIASGQGTASILFSAGASGTVSLGITVTTSGGCTSTGSTPVVINAQPACSMTGTNTICQGSSTVFCAADGMASYSWGGPGGFSASTQCITISTAGTYSVTTTDSNGCSSSCSQALTVNSRPACNISGTSVICQGGSTVFCATAGMASYSWAGPSAFSANSQCVTVSVAGLYSVTISDSNGCSSNCSQTLTVNPAPATPTAGSNSPIHEGGTLNLTAATVTGVTYSWTGPNSFTSSTQNPSIVDALAAASGTYTVTVTDSNGCTASSSTTALVSVLRIAAIARQGGNILITWIGDGGTTNQVQVTSGTANGSYSNNYTDLSTQLLLSGVGQVTTNYLEVGGATNAPSRYYRIRLVP